MNCATLTAKETNFTTFIEKARLLLGLLMMFTGLYFGLFSVGAGEGLGFLSFMASPFVMLNGR